MIPAAAVLLLAIITVAALVSSGSNEQDPSASLGGAPSVSPEPTLPASPSVSPTPSSSPLVPSSRFANRRGGYRFQLPEGWKARKQDSVTEVRAPRRAAAMSIGPVTASSLKDASRSMVEAVRSGYSDVQISARDRSPVGRYVARTRAGTAVNQRGARLRFLQVVVKSKGSFYGITVFTPESSDPAEVLPAVQTLVSSFETLKKT